MLRMGRRPRTVSVVAVSLSLSPCVTPISTRAEPLPSDVRYFRARCLLENGPTISTRDCSLARLVPSTFEFQLPVLWSHHVRKEAHAILLHGHHHHTRGFLLQPRRSDGAIFGSSDRGLRGHHDQFSLAKRAGGLSSWTCQTPPTAGSSKSKGSDVRSRDPQSLVQLLADHGHTSNARR